MKIFVFTGAGISVASGIPTYRGVNSSPMRLDKEIPQALQEAIKQAKPSKAHEALVKLEKDHEVTIVTQNIDGLHQLAGSKNVIELHGNCKDGVVLFGEPVDLNKMDRALKAAREANLAISIGSSCIVSPANMLLTEAINHAATFIENSIEDTPLSQYASRAYRHAADTIIPQLVDEIIEDNKPKSSIKRIDIKEFRELGLIQEINRRLLHPMGLALEVVISDEDGSEKLGGVWDFRNDPEGLAFQAGLLETETAREKARRVDELFNSKKEIREKNLGWHVQPIKN